MSCSTLQEYQEKREPCKDLLFVCSPQKRPVQSHSNEILARRRNDIRKTSDRRSFNKVANSTLEKYEITTNDDLKSLKGTYSEPSLIAASEGNPKRHRHRKRRDRNRLQKFGYEIRNVDEFLSKCSLSSPGNIPVVLSSSSTLYQTRPGGYQIEIPLPLGMVVNAVFKNQNWLYVQTPHAEEGYVGYTSCLPLGILPPATRNATSTSKPTPCWETNGDVFPRPCGNMTDSEKEIRIRGGTRSDGARTPRPRRLSSYKGYGEHHVDKLYLRAASQPRLTEKSYAQLRPTAKCRQHHSSSSTAATKTTVAANKLNNDDYIVLQKYNSRATATISITNTTASTVSTESTTKKSCANALNNNHNMGIKTRSLRQTLVAITNDYITDSITVRKGEIVTLLNCKETKDKRQWFYIKTRDGREGFIPAEFAGHGFL